MCEEITVHVPGLFSFSVSDKYCQVKEQLLCISSRINVDVYSYMAVVFRLDLFPGQMS